MSSKIWTMIVVVLIAFAFSLQFIVRGLLSVPIQGSVGLFFTGAALHLFAASSLDIFLTTIARYMPQFGLQMVLVMLPLRNLSGGMTLRESMPEAVQFITLGAPNTHFVILAQEILYCSAGLDAVWPQFITIAIFGTTLFDLALMRFR
jgi:ABC-2 type transport system permease protein